MFEVIKSILCSLLFTTLGLVAYYVTFGTFYEAWFPDYRSDSANYYFLGGLLLLILLPICYAIIQKLKRKEESFRILYSRYIRRINLLATGLFVLTFVYMSSQGTFFGIGQQGSGVYRVVPESE